MQTLKTTPGFLLGGGEMGERIRNFDWTKTPLGAPENWDQSLKTCVRIMLTSSQPIWIGWGKELIKLYNDPYRAIAGGKHPEALGKPASVVWKDIWVDIEPMLKKVMEKDEGIYVESQLLIMERYGYPEETYYTFSYSPVPGDNGGTAGMICYNTEDTERIINERSLKTLKELGGLSKKKSLEEVYEAAVESLQLNDKDFPCAIIYKIDEERNLASAFAFAGIDKNHPELPLTIDISNPGSMGKNLSRAVSENKVVVSNTAERWKNVPTGHWNVMPKLFAHIPISGANKKYPLAVLSVALNPYRKFDEAYKNFIQLAADQISLEVNNVLVLEEERKRSEALAEVDRAKTLFFTNISHEFRTPLTLMLGPIEEALKDKQIAPANVSRMEVAYRNAMRLLKLVNALLDFSRIESGRQKANFVLTDIVSFTKNLAANFRSIIEKAGLEFFINAEKFDQPVYIDKEMWEKIVFNLLSNAFKYTLKGNISIALYTENNNAVFTVTDTGVGIPENELPHMFDRFHRVENTTGRTFEGTGIGLSLTKELVQLHGGMISVDSKEGAGTSFTVTIPLGKEHLSPSQIKPEEKIFVDVLSDIYVEEAATLLESISKDDKQDRVALTQINKGLPLVMIVDDNADMRHHIEVLLKTKFNTTTAANGLDALEKLKSQTPDLILSDVMMPVMDGIELLKEIKSNKTTELVPVVLLTARAGEESKIEGWETGADDYLVKPFSSKELIARISSQIELAKKRRAAETQIRDLFMQAPAAIQILRGPQFVFELMNEAALSIINNAGGIKRNWQLQDVIGRTVEELMPETRGQGLIDLLEKVYKTGEPFIAHEYPLTYVRDGKAVEHFSKFAYVPLRDEDGNVTGIMITGDDITPLVHARKQIEESEQQLVHLFKHAPVGIVIYRGPELVVDMVNDQVLEMWGKKLEEVKGKPVREIFPEIDVQKNTKALYDASIEKFEKGESFIVSEAELTFQKKGELYTGWYSYIHEPINDLNGKPGRIIATAIEVTDQVAARKKIEETNRELKFGAAISKSIADAVISTSTFEDGYRITGWNKGAEIMYGWKEEEVIGKLARDVININASEEERKHWQASLDEKGYWKGEVVQRHKNGNKVAVLASVAYVKDDDGKILGTVGVNRDISEQKAIEEKIRESEKQLNNLANAMPQLVWMANPEGEVVYYNEKVAEFAGAEKGEDGKWTWEGLIHKNDAAASVEAWNNSVKTGSVYEIQHRVQMKDGTYRWHLSRGIPYKNEEGKIIRWFGTSTDIHVQKKFSEKLAKEVAERTEELKTSLNILHHAEESALMGNWQWNLTTNAVKWSDNLYRLFGCAPGEVEPTIENFLSFIHPDDRQLIDAANKRSFETHHPTIDIFRIITKQGSIKWIKGIGSKITIENDDYIIGTSQDVTELVISNEQLKQTNADLIRANKELESFNYIASHDLQEPLRKIQAFITLIEKNKEDIELTERYFEKIKSSAQRMSELIRSILNYTRLSRGGQEFSDTDLNKILNDVKTDFELLIKEKNATIKSTALPVVRSNALQMHQLFSNLISNSLKFSSEHPEITISSNIVTGDKIKGNIKEDPKRQFVQLTFRDNGIGFEPEFKDQIFQLFQRLHAKHEYRGTGIGLSIVKKIAEQHNGFVNADSVPGEGATFNIWLPVN